MLSDHLHVCLANTFKMSVKVRVLHWNVKGPNFPQYHKLFGDVYEDLNAAVDVIAELIRTLGSRAENIDVHTRFYEKATISDDYYEQFKMLVDDNNECILALLRAYQLAEETGELAISNVLQDRLSQHSKWKWFFIATGADND